MSHVQRSDALLSPEDQNVKKTEEYLTQHLEFTPKSFNDGLYNIVYDYINDGMDSLQKAIRQESECVVDELELSAGSKLIFENFVKNADKVFDKLEAYVLKNVFHVPRDFVYPMDLVQLKINSSEESDSRLDEEISDLTKKIIDSKREIAKLHQNSLDTVVATEENMKMLSLFESLEKIGKENNFSDLSEIDEVSEKLMEKKSCFFSIVDG